MTTSTQSQKVTASWRLLISIYFEGVDDYVKGNNSASFFVDFIFCHETVKADWGAHILLQHTLNILVLCLH